MSIQVSFYVVRRALFYKQDSSDTFFNNYSYVKLFACDTNPIYINNEK